MTDEQLQEAIQNISQNIANLSQHESDKDSSKEEERHKQLLFLQKETLLKIKEARDNKDGAQEFLHATTYGLLSSWGEKHSYLLHLLSANMKWSSFF
ncbi:hypothetical protein ACFLTP_03090 [Chloroflexota bacterium]